MLRVHKYVPLVAWCRRALLPRENATIGLVNVNLVSKRDSQCEKSQRAFTFNMGESERRRKAPVLGPNRAKWAL